MTERTNPPPGTPSATTGTTPGSSSAAPGSGAGSTGGTTSTTSPPLTKVPSGVHAMRRGGARREVTERVMLRTEDKRELEGWALNVSRGGLRAILEDKVILGQKFEVGVGTDEVTRRQGRVVWVQEELDGVIVGIEFTGASDVHKSVPPPPPGAQSEPHVAIAQPPPPSDPSDSEK